MCHGPVLSTNGPNFDTILPLSEVKQRRRFSATIHHLFQCEADSKPGLVHKARA